MSDIKPPIDFVEDKLLLLDQRKLPNTEEFVIVETLEQGFDAIKSMVVRGAPCIGFTAIYTIALWLKNHPGFSDKDLLEAGEYLKQARPTAVNLQYEIDRVLNIIKADKEQAYQKVVEFGHTQMAKAEVENRNMAIIAEQELLATVGQKKYQILTHCNTGFLACGRLGTALGVIQHLHEKNKLEHTWVDETRPYLQGARLTAYELSKMHAHHSIVVEGAASFLMQKGYVDAIFTGADRIVANGDTANKIGTSNLAVMAKHYKIPFYIVAPSSSFDRNTPNGTGIEIELRPQEEILSYQNHRVAPLESKAFNPSFDITDGKLITGIINENGIAKGDYTQSLNEILL